MLIMVFVYGVFGGRQYCRKKLRHLKYVQTGSLLWQHFNEHIQHPGVHDANAHDHVLRKCILPIGQLKQHPPEAATYSLIF